MTVIPMHMKRGIVLRFQSESPLDVCDCGNEPRFVQYYVKGTANHLNWFVKCETCRKRTRSRNKPQKAIDEWNEFGGTLYDDGRNSIETNIHALMADEKSAKVRGDAE